MAYSKRDGRTERIVDSVRKGRGKGNGGGPGGGNNNGGGKGRGPGYVSPGAAVGNAVGKYTPGKGDGTGGGGNGAPNKPPAPGKVDPYDFNTPYNDPKTVKQLVKSLVNLQYRPELQGAKQYAKQVPQYFDDYRKRLEAIQTGQQQYSATALQQLGQFGSTLAQGSAGVIGMGAQAQAQGAAPLGATPAAGVTTDAAQAAMIRQGLIGNMGGLLQNQAVAQSNYTANRAMSSGPLQIQAQTAAHQDIQGIRADKGAARVKVRGELREAFEAKREADRNFRLVKQEFGVDKATAKAGIQSDKRDAKAGIKNDRRDDKRAAQTLKQDAIDKLLARRDANRKERQDLNTWGYTNAEWRAKSEQERQAIIRAQKNYADDGEGSSGSSGGVDPAERRETRQEARKTTTEIGALFDRYKKQEITPEDGGAPRPLNDEERRALILNETDYTPAQVDIGLAIARGVKLSPKQYRQARSLGVFVPKGQRPVTVKFDPNDPKNRPGGGGH